MYRASGHACQSHQGVCVCVRIAYPYHLMCVHYWQFIKVLITYTRVTRGRLPFHIHNIVLIIIIPIINVVVDIVGCAVRPIPLSPARPSGHTTMQCVTRGIRLNGPDVSAQVLGFPCSDPPTSLFNVYNNNALFKLTWRVFVCECVCVCEYGFC